MLVYLESLPPSAWMRKGVWPFPVVNLLHMLGIALLFGGIAVLDLRVLGLARKLPVAALALLVLPIAGHGKVLPRDRCMGGTTKKNGPDEDRPA
ncbi:hypothetical protein [Sinorhizobium fredii]|nr:hypothetical protein [Sinorhizobium fredii]